MDNILNASGSTSFEFLSRVQVQEYFQLEFSANTYLRNRDSQKFVPNVTEEERFSSLPSDMLGEILKTVNECFDMQTMRNVSRFWRTACIDFVHASPVSALIPRKKALWICTIHDSNNIAFVSNYTSTHRKFYGKVLRFPESDILPSNTKTVASEAGLLFFKVQLPKPSTDIKLIICNPILMEYKVLPPLQEMAEDVWTTSSNIGLMVDIDSTTRSYKVIVASPGMKGYVYDSRSGVWTLGSAPPMGVRFSWSRNAVTHDGCMYCVAYTHIARLWFVMQYDTKTDTWTRTGDIPPVLNRENWGRGSTTQHLVLPDLVAVSDGVVLVAENAAGTNKHVFQLNKESCNWDFICYVPIPSGPYTSLGRLKCIGIQKTLFFQFGKALPLFEIDLVLKRYAWCLPVGLYSKNEYQRCSEIFDVKDALAFEPSLHPVS